MSTVKQGDIVSIQYEGRYEDGTVFESTGQELYRFAAGGSEVIRGVSQAVIGMQEGERKTVTIPPSEGYGDRRVELQREVERSMLPESASIGDQLTARVGDQDVPVWVIEMDDDSAVIDANHPLAGFTLEFDITLVKVEDPASGDPGDE